MLLLSVFATMMVVVVGGAGDRHRNGGGDTHYSYSPIAAR